MPCFARDFGIIVNCSENADCGTSEQNLASYNIIFYIDTDTVPGNPPCLILRKFVFEEAPVSCYNYCRDAFPHTLFYMTVKYAFLL